MYYNWVRRASALYFYMSDNRTSLPSSNLHGEESLAADVIRQKVAQIYQDEPNAQQEMAESKAVPHRSKHQQFMYELSTSGKDLATVQTEWHQYYQNLPNDEKHQVWHEFYASQSSVVPAEPSPVKISEHKAEAAKPKTRAKKKDNRKPEEIRKIIKDKVTAGGKLEAKHHLQSLLFGLGMGVLVLLVFLFGLFNEIVIAPFIQPSRAQASTPIIVSQDSAIASGEPKVIIPKINVEIPTDFSIASTDEKLIEEGLDNGVVHYPTTVLPGELGNTAFFGHSSNNIFNKGKYKFAFVLLHTLEQGDTFYLTYNNKSYVYKVVSKKVVDPSEVSVLGTVGGYPATATLITCDPPGTSLKRLVVVGEQISPDPSGNSKSDAATTTLSANPAASLPGNGPTLAGRLLANFWAKIAVATVLSAATLFGIVKLFGYLTKKN